MQSKTKLKTQVVQKTRKGILRNERRIAIEGLRNFRVFSLDFHRVNYFTNGLKHISLGILTTNWQLLMVPPQKLT